MIRIIAAVTAAVLTLAFAVSITASLTIWTRYVPDASPWLMFRDASSVPRMAMTFSVVLLITALVLAFMRDRSITGGLIGLAIAGPCLGLYAALTSLLNIHIVESHIGPVRFAVKAPSYAELILSLSFGLLVGSVAALGLLRKRT